MTRTRGATTTRLVQLGVVVLSVAYVAWHLRRGWIPSDDGALAQSAERVLQGELPHRDFDDVYTGGLAMLNAGAFRILGTTLWTLRLVLLAAFVIWVPVVYWVANRIVRPLAAAAITLLAVAWSVPNYPAAMPSWYNLFLATLGIAALFRHLEDERYRWLVLAGIAGGFSVLAKITGLYYVAGVLLFLVFQAHAEARRTLGGNATIIGRSTSYAVFVTSALILFVAGLAALVRQQLHAPEVVHFVFPSVLLAALLIRNEWSNPAERSRARFIGLARLVLPFLGGVALPVAIFLVPYVRTGALGALASGVFILPTKRFGVAIYRELPLWTALALAPLAALTVRAQRSRVAIRRWEIALLAVVLAFVVVATGTNAELYRTVWYSVRSLVPVLTMVGVAILARPRAADASDPLHRERTMLLLSVTALSSLVQFPFSAPIYFCYVAPLVVLTTVAVFRYVRPVPSVLPATLLAFYMGFAVFRLNTNMLGRMGSMFLPYSPVQRMTSERSGLDVRVVQAKGYDKVVALLRQHAHGGYTWAAPDSPEIYFLTGLRNPTRSLFEFIGDSTSHTERVLRALEERQVTAIVLNRRSGFSPAISEELKGELATRYPAADSVGAFLVRWRP